jgi:hypothetical protein
VSSRSHALNKPSGDNCPEQNVSGPVRGCLRSQTLVSLQSQFSDAAADGVSRTPVVGFVARVDRIWCCRGHWRPPPVAEAWACRIHPEDSLQTKCESSQNGGATGGRRGSSRYLHIACATRLVLFALIDVLLLCGFVASVCHLGIVYILACKWRKRCNAHTAGRSG